MGYDQVFKGILRRFFRDFMELFFPDVAGSLDFDSVDLLDKELFKGFPDGVQRTPDFVVRVRTREGKPEMVIVHIEAQPGRGGASGGACSSTTRFSGFPPTPPFSPSSCS
jgi:hypothetical protein